MKLLHVISSCDPASGGPIEGIKQMYKYLKKFKINPEILCSDDPKKKFIKDKNLPKVYALGPGKLSYQYNPALKNWLYKNINNYDCVIIHGLWQYHNYAVWKVAKDKKKFFYIFFHGMLDPWFNKTYFFKYLKKIIYWNLIQYKIVKDAKSVFFTSLIEKKLARKSFYPYRANEKLVGYGTSGNPYKYDLKNNLFFKLYPKLKNKKIILFFGRVHPKKGVDLLLEAFIKIINQDSKIHLVIAGPYEKKYFEFLNQTYVRKLEKVRNSITWTGPIYNKLKWDTINSCSFFCLPSHQENFGISVTEALSCKKPVLITNKVNIYRDIKKYDSGLVCNDDLEGLILQLKKMINLSKAELSQMSKNAYYCYTNNFNIKKNIKKLVDIIS